MATSHAGSPTQRFLNIAEIRDDLVILKDGTIRAVLLISSINFALKSQDEQNAIVQAYMQFVNSIDFPIQIVIQSRKMNIDKYLDQIADSEKKLQNDLLKRQIHDYRDFIKQLVKLGDIMQKRFYVVIPLNPATSQQRSFFDRMKEVLTPSNLVRISDERFKKQTFEINLRISQVASGLSSMSLSAVQLDTQSLIELYYNVYNPDVSESQPLTDIDRLQLEKAP